MGPPHTSFWAIQFFLVGGTINNFATIVNLPQLEIAQGGRQGREQGREGKQLLLRATQGSMLQGAGQETLENTPQFAGQELRQLECRPRHPGTQEQKLPDTPLQAEPWVSAVSSPQALWAGHTGGTPKKVSGTKGRS